MEKKNEKGKVQLKGQLKLYIQWPAIMSLLLIAMDLWVYKLDHSTVGNPDGDCLRVGFLFPGYT